MGRSKGNIGCEEGQESDHTTMLYILHSQTCLTIHRKTQHLHCETVLKVRDVALFGLLARVRFTYQ